MSDYNSTDNEGPMDGGQIQGVHVDARKAALAQAAAQSDPSSMSESEEEDSKAPSRHRQSGGWPQGGSWLELVQRCVEKGKAARARARKAALAQAAAQSDPSSMSESEEEDSKAPSRHRLPRKPAWHQGRSLTEVAQMHVDARMAQAAVQIGRDDGKSVSGSEADGDMSMST
jgi:hypothetical protein